MSKETNRENITLPEAHANKQCKCKRRASWSEFVSPCCFLSAKIRAVSGQYLNNQTTICYEDLQRDILVSLDLHLIQCMEIAPRNFDTFFSADFINVTDEAIDWSVTREKPKTRLNKEVLEDDRMSLASGTSDFGSPRLVVENLSHNLCINTKVSTETNSQLSDYGQKVKTNVLVVENDEPKTQSLTKEAGGGIGGRSIWIDQFIEKNFDESFTNNFESISQFHVKDVTSHNQKIQYTLKMGEDSDASELFNITCSFKDMNDSFCCCNRISESEGRKSFKSATPAMPMLNQTINQDVTNLTNEYTKDGQMNCDMRIVDTKKEDCMHRGEKQPSCLLTENMLQSSVIIEYERKYSRMFTSIILEENIIRPIIRSMNKFPPVDILGHLWYASSIAIWADDSANHENQTWCYLNSKTRKQIKDILREQMIDEGAFLILIRSMRKYPRNHDVQAAACNALGNLCNNIKKYALHLDGVSDVLLSIIHCGLENEQVMQQAFYALSQCVGVNVLLLIELLEWNFKKHTGSKVSRNSIKTNFKDDQQDWRGLEWVIFGMKLYPENANLQQFGLNIILHICSNDSEKDKLRHNGIMLEEIFQLCVVKNAIEGHPQNACLMGCALGLVYHLGTPSSSCDPNKKSPFLEWLLSRDGISILVVKMVLLCHDEQVFGYGCACIRRLLCLLDRQNLDQSMRRRSTLAEKLSHSMTSADTMDQLQRFLYDCCADMVQLFVSSIEFFKESVPVQERIFKLLALIIRDGIVRESIIKCTKNQSSTISVAVSILMTNRSSVTMERDALKVLYYLSLASERSNTSNDKRQFGDHSLRNQNFQLLLRIGNCGGLIAILNAMKYLQSDPTIQYHGCGALLSLICGVPENTDFLKVLSSTQQMSTEDPRCILIKASEHFPVLCRENVNKIFKILKWEMLPLMQTPASAKHEISSRVNETRIKSNTEVKVPVIDRTYRDESMKSPRRGWKKRPATLLIMSDSNGSGITDMENDSTSCIRRKGFHFGLHSGPVLDTQIKKTPFNIGTSFGPNPRSIAKVSPSKV